MSVAYWLGVAIIIFFVGLTMIAIYRDKDDIFYHSITPYYPHRPPKKKETWQTTQGKGVVMEYSVITIIFEDSDYTSFTVDTKEYKSIGDALESINKGGDILVRGKIIETVYDKKLKTNRIKTDQEKKMEYFDTICPLCSQVWNSKESRVSHMRHCKIRKQSLN